MTKLDKENLWKIVKETRKLLLSLKEDPECQDSNTILSDNLIKENNRRLEEALNLDPTSVPFPSNRITVKSLETAAEIFTYLNFCPPVFLSLIQHILKTGTPKDIILGMP